MSKAIKDLKFTTSKTFELKDEKDIQLLGIYSWNREEWIITDIACLKNSIVTVPLYETLGQGSLEFISNQTEIETIFVSEEKIKNLLEIKS